MLAKRHDDNYIVFIAILQVLFMGTEIHIIFRIFQRRTEGWGGGAFWRCSVNEVRQIHRQTERQRRRDRHKEREERKGERQGGDMKCSEG